MSPIDQASYAAVQPELLPGETVLWAGSPSPKIIFHAQDAMMIPFSLLWGGFAIFWEATGLIGGNSHGSPGFFALWGLPFVLIGQYLIWGRFVYTAWLKKRTFYAVTNQRVLALQRGRKLQTSSVYIDALPLIDKDVRGDGFGTVLFGPKIINNRGWNSWNAVSFQGPTTFVDIEDADSVYRLVSDLRQKSRTTQTA
jgi:hypothetical protein